MSNMYLRRYFCKFEDRDKVSYETFLALKSIGVRAPGTDEPDEVYPREWEFYQNYPSIVLLGPPRSGKSTEFKHQCQRVDGFLIELRDVIDPSDPTSAWSPGQLGRWNAFLQGEEKTDLFFDSLDEGKLETKKMAMKLVKWLQGLGPDVLKRLRVHVSCREGEWSKIDKSAWEKLLLRKANLEDADGPAPQYIELALLPLDADTIEEALISSGIEPQSFYASIPSHTETLLHWPQSFRMMVEMYASGEMIGGQIQSLYQQIVEKRIQESNELRQETGNTTLGERMHIARGLATLSVFSGRDVIAVRDVNTASEIDAGLACSNLSQIEEVLGSELFEAYTQGKYRFEDRYLAAHLAAAAVNQKLSNNDVNLASVINLVYPDQNSREIIPALRPFAAWLACMNRNFRTALLERSPGLLLSDEFPGDLEEQVRRDVWNWMKSVYGDRLWFDDSHFRDNARKLACDAVIQDVGVVLASPHLYGRDIRIFALEILRQAENRSHEDIIIQRILDEKEDEVFKRYAIRALEDIAPDRLPELKTLLDIPSEQISIEVVGSLLNALFPEHLTTEEIIAQLRRKGSARVYGSFQVFVYRAAKEANPEARAEILDALAENLRAYHIARKNRQPVPDWTKEFVPAYEFDEFLLEQLKAWGKTPEYFPLLESWLDLLAESNAYGLISGSGVQKVSEFIQQNDELRRELCRLRIERLFAEKGDGFDPSMIHLHERLYLPQKNDLEYWKKVVMDWGTGPQPKLEAAWYELQSCWNQSEPNPKMLDWIEEAAERCPSIQTLWDRDKVRVVNHENMEWRWERSQRKREEQKQAHQEIEKIKARLNLIRDGHAEWIIYLVSKRFGEEENVFSWLNNKVGTEAEHAFREGMLAFWKNEDFPPVDMFQSNEIPWWAEVVRMAVQIWLGSDGNWEDLDADLRQKAIRAAPWCLNDLPDWFFDVVEVEHDWALDYCQQLLAEEAKTGKEHWHLPHLFAGQGHQPFVRRVCETFLEHHPDVPKKGLQQILCVVVEEKPSASLLDIFLERAKAHLSDGDIETCILYAAAAFRFRQNDIWQWVKDEILTGEDLANRFRQWLGCLEMLHARFDFGGHWPSWLNIDVVAGLVPFMFEVFPPESDVSTNGVMSGDILQRHDRGHLRDNSFQFLADSGDDKAGQYLKGFLSEDWAHSRRDLILHSIEQWHKKHSEGRWIPLAPEDISKVLSENAIPIRTADELFAFCCKVVEDVRSDIEHGEAAIKRLLWNDDGAPKKEKDFQLLVFDKIKGALSRYRHCIVAGREIDIAGNFPDVFISIVLPSGQRARVFIEMKRQQHNEVVDAIENQLVSKYLSDADTFHGIYLVGWYGSDYFGSYKEKVKDLNGGKLPASRMEMETALQKAANRAVLGQNIEVRVKVMDLSQ